MRKCVQLLFVASFALCAVGMSQSPRSDSTSHSEPEIRLYNGTAEETSSRSTSAVDGDAAARRKEALAPFSDAQRKFVSDFFGEDTEVEVKSDADSYIINIHPTVLKASLIIRHKLYVDKGIVVWVASPDGTSKTYTEGMVIPVGTPVGPGSVITFQKGSN